MGMPFTEKTEDLAEDDLGLNVDDGESVNFNPGSLKSLGICIVNASHTSL